jgi:hypothetical protein
VAAIFVNESGRNEQSLLRNAYRCIPPSFGSFEKAVSEKQIFFLEINQSETGIVCGGHVC